MALHQNHILNIYEDNLLEAMPGNEYWYWIESVDLGEKLITLIV